MVLSTIFQVSTKSHTVLLNACRIETDSTHHAVYVNSTATYQRTYMSDCVISQKATSTTTLPLVEVTSYNG